LSEEIRIDIHNRNDNFVIRKESYPKIDELQSFLHAEHSRHADRQVRIRFEPEALELLFDHIHWGQPYQHGDAEQAGLLIGNYYYQSNKPSGTNLDT